MHFTMVRPDFRIKKVNSRRWSKRCCVVSHDSCGWLRCESTCIVSLCKAAGVFVCWREQGVPVVFTMYCMDLMHATCQRSVFIASALPLLGEAEVGNRQSYVDCGVVTIRYAEIGRLCCVGGKSRVSVVLVRHTFCPACHHPQRTS